MLRVSRLIKSFTHSGGEIRAIDDVSFAVEEGHCYALLGPSGCGKTTTLRCVAGLEQADTGTIEIGGKTVSDPASGVFVPVHERSIGMVFQSYAIWPHLDVFENVAYPLRVKRPRVRRDEIGSRVQDALRLVGMAALSDRPATQLSGGQQQRVALARAIVRQPALLLLDEPLSNLDARLREQMRDELKDMIARIGVTALYVTHDQTEAFALADRVAVIAQGRIVQAGAPRDIYAHPSAPFVATFLGAANVVPGHVEARGANGTAIVALDANPDQRLTLATECGPGEPVEIIIRPEDVRLAMTAASGTNRLRGRIVGMTFQGSVIECELDLGGVRLRALVHPSADFADGATVVVQVDPSRCTVFRKEGER
jgi:iron(III) transport system ATP-binding protein